MATEKTHPELPEDGPRLLSVTYINHTRGLWVRHHVERKELELWYDGVFHSSWDDTLDAQTFGMVLGRAAIEIGERKAKAEIRALLGVK